MINRNFHALRCLRFENCIFVFVSLVFVPYICAEENGILVSCSDRSAPAVQILSGTSTPNMDGVKAALLFLPPSETQPERWTPVQENISSLDEIQNEHLRNVGPSRNVGGSIADSIAAQTVQLEQLQTFLANRNLPRYEKSTIFSPADGAVVLNPCPTFRRLPSTDQKTQTEHYPALVAHLFHFNSRQSLFKISFEQGQKVLHWNEISQLPERFREGLPPGTYQIQIEGITGRSSFTVKPIAIRRSMDSRIGRFESLLGKDDPITVQIAAETLSQDRKNGPFFADALDTIAALPIEKSTPYLENLQSYFVLRMSGREGVVRGGNGELPQDEQEKSEQAQADTDPVADADADSIHQLLLNEKWNAAEKRLEQLQEKLDESEETLKNKELQALCCLYRGMILAESGAARLDDGYAEFSTAMDMLDEIAELGTDEAKTVAVSQFRCANNFGNFLSRLAQDQLYNHALAIATGDGAILTSALKSWSHAMDVYQKALKIATEDLSDQSHLAAATKINIARLYALLGDIVRTVDSEKNATEIENAAYATASRLAQEVANTKLVNEERLFAAAHHILADIAFRQKDQTRCRREAEIARNFYVQSGTLSGVEAVERLFGMLDTTDRKTALKHFAISNAISEALLEQVPTDEIGLSRAGFIARRAYVNERMIELLLEDGQIEEALATLEAAKGRSLQSVLAEAGVKDESAETLESRSVTEILENWPKDLAALEYFVGSEKCWGFLICGGKVEAFPFWDSQGQPLASRELVASVQKYLNDTESLAGKMSKKIMNRIQLEHEWEPMLHQLRLNLIPDTILAKIRSAKPKQVLIVPHHVLHYLPFSGLVVEPDNEKRKKNDLPLSKFLLDESFDVFYAPTLIAWDTLSQQENRPLRQVAGVGISHFSDANDLQGAKKDIVNLRNAFQGKRVETIMEDSVTKTNLKKHLQQRGLLLIATHGANNPTNPLEGCLLIRDGLGYDDEITVRELYETTIGSDLIFLSACYSSLADQTPMPGDDLFGLQRAMLHGGARAVVSGSWDVFDPTAVIIVEKFMQHLAAGEPAIAALNKAQREFLKQERESLGTPLRTIPYFWAVFTLNGDGRVVFATEKP